MLHMVYARVGVEGRIAQLVELSLPYVSYNERVDGFFTLVGE